MIEFKKRDGYLININHFQVFFLIGVFLLIIFYSCSNLLLIYLILISTNSLSSFCGLKYLLFSNSLILASLN